MSQSKKEVLREFLAWGLEQPLPVVLSQKNKGILGEVPARNIQALLDDCFGKEPTKPKEPKKPKKSPFSFSPKKPKAEDAPKAEETPVAPPPPLAYGHGEAPDEIPNPAPGAPVPPKGA